MSNGNKGAASIVVAVVLTLAVAGTGGYMIGNRAGLKAAKMDTASVGSVNGESITQLDLYTRMYKSTAGATEMDQIIREKLVNQAAQKAKVTVTAQEVDAAIAKIKADIGGETQFQSALTQAGLTLDGLKQNQEFRLKVQKLLEKDIPTDDATLKTWFEANKAQFDKREVHARHILLKTQEEAVAVKAELDKGADFATLAKAKSIEPAAKDSGGDLGFFGLGKMVPEFEKVVFSMKVNEISAPFQSTNGWHVAQVLETRGAAGTFDTDKAAIKDGYIQAKLQEKAPAFLQDLQDKAKIVNPLAPAK